MKPTKAQLAWLKAIAGGNATISGHSWVQGMRCYGSRGPSTYVMTLALRDAGWIDKTPSPDSTLQFPRYTVTLTDAGRAALAQK